MKISQNKTENMPSSENSIMLIEDWALPSNVHAAYTTRKGGVSKAPYNGFNLASHVGDALADVKQNRHDLTERLNLPAEPIWLQQEHTDIAVDLTAIAEDSTPIADASWTQQPGQVAIVMTADCLPILVVAKDGNVVAAIHAGWKGLADGIVTKTILQMPCEPQNLTAWIGPAISQKHFEVGEDVWQAFVNQDAQFADCFVTNKTQAGKFFADLPAIAAIQMQQLGVASVVKSGLCTYAQEAEFFSYRRDGQTGRMASLIWIE